MILEWISLCLYLRSKFNPICLHQLEYWLYRTLPEDSKPILILDKPNIIHKLRSTTGQNTNDDINSGLTIRNGTSSKRKRNVDAAEIDDSLDQIAKRGKVYEKSIGDDTTVLVTDEGNGAILIDDD